MKKILTVVMAMILILSMGMTVMAEDAVAGSKENPIYVSTPMAAPSSESLAAGASVYYSYPGNFFDGYTLTVSGVTAVEVNDTLYTETNTWGEITVELTGAPNPMYPYVVGFINDSDSDAFVWITSEAPVGTEQAPYSLGEGDNEIAMNENVINSNGGVYYMEFMPSLTATYTFTAYNMDEAAEETGFELVINEGEQFWADDDGDGIITAELEMESYSPISIMVGITGWDIPQISLTVEGPAVGSEVNPEQIYEPEDLGNIDIAEGETYYYSISYGFEGKDLSIQGDAGMTVTMNGTAVDVDDEGYAQFELVAENYQIIIAISNTASAYLEILFPEGDENNPEVVWDGEVEVSTEGNDYYMTYYALNDGVLTVTPDSIDSIGDIMLENKTLFEKEELTDEDYENLNNWMSDNGEYDENWNVVYEEGMAYVSIPVSMGDEIVIHVIPKTDMMTWEPLPIDVTLTVEGPEAPVGSIYNPAEIVEGDTEIVIEEGAMFYVASYTATADGTLTAYVDNADLLYEMAMGLEEADDALLLSESEDGKLVMEVKKDDVVLIAMVVEPDDELNFPGAELTLTVDLEEDVVEDNNDNNNDDNNADDNKTDDTNKDDSGSPVTGPVTGAGIALVVAAVSGAYVFLSKKR